MFNGLDVFLILIALVFILLDTLKGFVSSFFNKASFVLALLFAFLFFQMGTRFYGQFIAITFIASLLGFISIFAIVFVIVKIFQSLTKTIFFSNPVMKSLDRSLGFLFGIVEAFVLIFFILFLFHTQKLFPVDTLLGNSFFYTLLQPLMGFRPVLIKG